MSLIMPIMINDSTIGALTIHRLKMFDGHGEYEYEWELCMHDKPDLMGNRRPYYTGGTVVHSYADGALALIKKVMEYVPDAQSGPK